MKKLATGVFMWTGTERVTERYGEFYAADCSYSGIKPKAQVVINEDAIKSLLLCRVRVVAKVIERRKSGHAGDKFHKLKPKPAKVGTEVEVGIGILHASKEDCVTFIRLQPEDGREIFWCDPRRFFQLHDQTVELYAEETTAPAHPVFQAKPVQGDQAIDNGDGTLQFKTSRPGGKFVIQSKVENLGDGMFSITAPSRASGTHHTLTRE